MYLVKDSVNKVVMEMWQSSRLSNPFFLFEFKNDFDIDNVVYFNSADLSDCNRRYNLFEITLTGSTTDYSNSILDLKTGQWTCNVYEATGQTLSVSATTGQVLATELVVVDGEDIITNPIYQ